jgi:hypothetical protein
MYQKTETSVNRVVHRLSTREDLPTPRFVRLCSRHECGPHLAWTDWEDVLSILDDSLCILRLADTVYIMPQLCDEMWGNA